MRTILLNRKGGYVSYLKLTYKIIMNQILVTEKLYITPELKRKKKIYKANFILSILVIIVLVGMYFFTEYDRNKSEAFSQEILEAVGVGDTTTINVNDEVWILALDDNEDKMIVSATEETDYTPETTSSGKYTAANGKTYNTIGEITIPSIDVHYSILSETSDALLKVSVCKFWGGEPNEVGNLCIAGHNYRNKRFFSKVINMQEGDIIQIKDLKDRVIEYEVYTTYTVDPTDVSCTSQITNGEKRVTLITCTNDSKQRVIVQAREKKA